LLIKKEATRFYLTVLKLIRILVKVIKKKCKIVNKYVMAGGIIPPFFIIKRTRRFLFLFVLEEVRLEQSLQHLKRGSMVRSEYRQ